MQFWPRKRAKRSFPRMRHWTKNIPMNIQGFIGYKAGMTHMIVRDNSPHTLYKNRDVAIPVTIIECPPLKPLSLRFYKKPYTSLILTSEIFSKKLTKEIKKYIKLPKKEEKEPENFDEIRLVVHTQPYLTGIGQKKPEILEIAISGENNAERLNYAKNILEKDIQLHDIFKEQKYFDVHSITKGKGFQGTVKRFGVKVRQHKAEKTKRGIGSLGSWHPNKVLYTVPQSGKMGYHQRTEYNKLNLLMESNPKKINPKSGFLHYGLIKNEYIILKGSIPGPPKRTVILTPNRRKKQPSELEIKSINLDSKQ